MDSRHYWEENGGPVKYENYNSSDGYGRSDGNLNFATGASVLVSEDVADYGGYLKKGKVSKQQDPMSHRIIEKRRRDRMNNCLADLSRLIPPNYCKKDRGRIEKTEIIEMAIRHLKYLKERADLSGTEQQSEGPISVEHFRLGYQECRSEVMRYLVETQGYLPTDSLCAHLVRHLNRHCDSIIKGDQLNHPRSNPETTSSSSGGSGSGYSADKPGGTPQSHRPDHNGTEQNNNYDYRKRYEGPQSFAPSDPRDDYITLPFYEEDPAPLVHQTVPPNLRSIRKVERDECADHAHSYKFKNNIKQRFSQDCDEAHDMTTKRRRLDSSSATTTTSTEENHENQELSTPAAEPRDRPSHLAPEPPPIKPQAKICIPVFALHAPGKYYVPLNVSYESLSPYVGLYDILGPPPASPSLHPVTINVNFLSEAKQKVDTSRKWHPV